PAVDGSVRQGHQTVQEARSGHGNADARLAGQITGDRGSVTRVRFVAERNHPETLGLRQTGQVGNGNTRQTIEVGDAVEFEGIEDQVKAVGNLVLLLAGGSDLGFNGTHGILLFGGWRPAAADTLQQQGRVRLSVTKDRQTRAESTLTEVKDYGSN